MSPLDLILEEIFRHMRATLDITRGTHIIFRGSHQAALFEAQGGIIGSGEFNHLVHFVTEQAVYEKRYISLQTSLNQLTALNPAVGVRIRALLQPALSLFQEYSIAGRETDRAIKVLQVSDATRFAGVSIGKGGLGAAVGRTNGALVSNQLIQISVQLEARGIEPRLISSNQVTLQPLLQTIQRLPIDGKEAGERLAASIAAVRLLLMQMVSRAYIVGVSALQATLLSVEEFLVGLGSRLSTPLVIPTKLLKQAAGIPDLGA